MINELGNRIKEISEILPVPENERKLREQLQLLYMIADKVGKHDLSKSRKITKSVRLFAKSRLNELDDTKILSVIELEKRKCELNALLLKILKKLDKEGRRISFCSRTEKIYVMTNEKAIMVLFERLMFFCKNRMSVEIKENRIKIKSDCSFSELIEVRNCKSDLMLVINKILSFHLSSMFFSSQNAGCEITLSLNGMLCNEGNQG